MTSAASVSISSSPASPWSCCEPCSALRFRSSICRRISSELPLFLGVFQAMLLGEALLSLGDELCALVRELPFDRQLQVFPGPLELTFALPDREFERPPLLEFS